MTVRTNAIETLGLDHVGIVFGSLDAATRLFGEALALPVTAPEAPGWNTHPFRFVRVGQAWIELIEGDGQRPLGFDHLALRVAGLERATAQAQAAGFGVAVPARDGAGGSRVVMLEPLKGIRVQLVERPADLPEPASTPDAFVERIDHFGVASDDNAAYERIFAGAFGFPVESRQTDTETHLAVESFTSDRYGIVVHSRPPRLIGGLTTIFITIGDCELEILQDVNPALGAAGRGRESGSTQNDQSAIAKWVDRRGPGLHHLAFKVPDIDAALARMGHYGAELLDQHGRPGGRAGLIGFMHPRSTGGILLHFVQRS